VGATPDGVAISRDGAHAYVALAGEDSVAVLERDSDGFRLVGFIPTGWYPTGVAVHPTTGELLVASAKGLGSRYLEGMLPPKPDRGGPQAISRSYYSLSNNMPGLVTRITPPDTVELSRLSQEVRENIRYTLAGVERSPHNPIPARPGEPSPIKHVIYIVRENRTFDQVFGDLGLSRDDVDAAPDFELLAEATPNAHALQQRFATSDRFFSDGEASVQGHWWTAGANVSEYTERGWLQNYSNRNRPYDFVVPIAVPRGCTIFNTSLKRVADTQGTFTFKNYGEIIGGLLPPSGFLGVGVPGKEVSTCDDLLTQHPANFFAGMLARIQDLSWDDRERLKLFLTDVGLDESGNQVGDPEKNFLPNFVYFTMPQDHTTGLAPDRNTPRAQVAQNDEALGRLVAAISKSRYWPESLIIVVEDDSQDGPDHVDGHRNVMLVISPWAKHTAADGRRGGYVSHQRYDQASPIRTIDLILGLEALSSYDEYAAPLYDLFQDNDDPSQLTSSDLAAYDLVEPPPFVEELGTAFLGSNAAALRDATSQLDLSHGVDRAGPMLEKILWETTKPGIRMPAELEDRLAKPAVSSDEDEGD
jgi:hypothetical protein